jgi:anti-sigma B factor antagonist
MDLPQVLCHAHPQLTPPCDLDDFGADAVHSIPDLDFGLRRQRLGKTLDIHIFPFNLRCRSGPSFGLTGGVRACEGVFSMSSQPRRRRLEVEDIGEVTVVNFTDKKILDEQNIQIIGEQLFSLVDELGRRKLILNFSNVEYLSSAALGKFITLNKKVNAAGGRLVLCNIDPQIYEVFEITKLNKLFNIQKEEQAALQAF